MIVRCLILLAVAILGSQAFARGGTGAANAEYTNVKTQKGLCTPNNKDEPYYKEGYCESLAEQFGKNQCTKDKLEEIRQRMLDDKDRTAKGRKMKNIDKPFTLGIDCDSKDNNKHMSDILKDPKQFSYIMMQFFAMTTIKESNWDVLNKEKSGGAKGPSGLLNLSLEKDGIKDMDNKDYACGCKDKVTTTSGQSGVTVEGQSPGPLDGHHSQTCGSYMALTLAAKDGTLFSGSSKEKGTAATADEPAQKDGRRGAAKLFASLETDSDPKIQEEKDKWRSDKMKTFCERYWASSDSKTNPWERQLTEDNNGGTKSSR